MGALFGPDGLESLWVERSWQVGKDGLRVLGEAGLAVHCQDHRQVPVSLVVVQSVSHHEPIRALEASVLDGKRGDAADALVQESADLERSRLPGPQRAAEI